MKNPRARLAAGVVVAVLAGVALLALTDGGADDEEPVRPVRAALVLEQFDLPQTGERELLVSLAQPRLNTLENNRGERVVLLRCADSAGATLVRRPAEWPLLEEVGYLPHIHQPASREQLARIRSCSVTGPGVELAGRVSGSLPLAE